MTGPVVVVLGPTAVGKSTFAVALAQRVGGEVLNADSMQLYRGMDIGTAKLAPAERGGVPHHLLDVWDLTRTASVADYQQLARQQIDAVLARGMTPILVGGSGLYLRAAVDRIEFPGTDEKVRAELEAELADRGAAALHTRLATADPVAAAAISPANSRRVIRALEVMALTGRSFTATLPAYDAVYDVVHIGLDVATVLLDERIETRVRSMVDGGFLDEVRRLEAAGLRKGVTASRALGYAQLLHVLAGDLGLADAVEQTTQATRRFVRRQRSWFRRDPRVTWFDATGDVLSAGCGLVAAARIGDRPALPGRRRMEP